MARLKRSRYLLKIINNAILIILLVMAQISFFSLAPKPFHYFNLILPIVFFVTIILSYEHGFWLAFFSGLALDLFSYLSFGTMILTMVITVVAVNSLFNNFFTNRSFYSLLILGLLGNLVYIVSILLFNLVFFLVGVRSELIGFFSISNIFGLLLQILFNLALLALLFLTFNFLSKKLKSVFY